MKRWLAMLLICCIAVLPLSGMVCTVGAATQTTYAVDTLAFTAGYASSTDGSINLSAVTPYDAATVHDLQYTADATELASASGIPYQVFDVDLEGKTTGNAVIHYSGSTKDGERVAVKAYNVKTRTWDTVGTFVGKGEVSASLNIASYNDNGNIHVAAMLDYVTNGSNMMIWSSDPQHYTEFADLHEYYYTIYQYAAEQYTAGKAGYIFTTGDLVDDRPYSSKAPRQWEVADQAMSYVEAVGMPNGVVTGNHDVGDFKKPDYSEGAADVDYSMFAKTFPASRYENERWYGGSLNNNTSHYDLVTIGNVDFLVMLLGYGVEATDETIAWANEVLRTYPHRTAIIGTHHYLDALEAEYGSRGQLIFDKIVDPNPNVKMVVCGHDDGSVCKETKASDGRVVYEVLADYQGIEAEDREFYANEHYIGKVSDCCGDGYIRLLTVEGETLTSITYSPVTGRYNPFGDVENLTLDLDCGTPDRSMATAMFSAAILGTPTTATNVDRMTVTTDDNGAAYSAVTYATVPSAPSKADKTAWPATSYGTAATPSSRFFAHAAKEAPDVMFKVDLLEAAGLGDHPAVSGTHHIGDYQLNTKINLNLTPYLYYSFAQPSDSSFTFATINDTATAPWITFLDTRKGGTTLNYGSDAWDAASGQQYFTGSASGCIDMRTMLSVSGATTWEVEQLNLYAKGNKSVVLGYLFFGSEPLDLIGSSYGEAATPAAPYKHHAAADAPMVAHKANLLNTVNLNENAIIWTTVKYGNNALNYKVDLNKTPYLYYSFAQSADSRFTFALNNENTNVPWLTFLDTRAGGATFNKGDTNWNNSNGEQYFTDSATGCIDMRQFQYDKSVGEWIVEQVNFYTPDNDPVMVNYLFFGSAAIGGESTDGGALDALRAKADATSTDGMTTASVNALKSAKAAAACVDRNDAAAVAHTYSKLADALGALTPVFTTEVNTANLVSVKKYTMKPDSWLCGATLKALSSSSSYTKAESTSTGMRLHRSSACPHTYPNIVDQSTFTVKPNGGLYLKLDARMETGWAISMNIKQDDKDPIRVHLNAGIINSFYNHIADNLYGTFNNVYDISEVFYYYDLDPTAIFEVTGTSITTVGAGSGWNYYNQMELLTGPSTYSNYNELENTIAYANSLTKSMYTSASWSTMQSALTKANTSMSTAGLSQYRINLSVNRLKVALRNLEFTTFYEPYQSLLANDLGAWRNADTTVTRGSDRHTVIKNTNGSWSSADFWFTAPRRISVKDHQLELNMNVAGKTNILLLVDGEWVSITKKLPVRLDGEDIVSGDYNLKVPLTDIFGSDRPTVVLEAVRIWSVGDIGNNAVDIARMRIDDLDTFRFNNTLTTYGVAATPDAPYLKHAAKNGPTVTHKVDLLAACGLDHPTVTGFASYGFQEMLLKIDLTKTPYLYYSIVQGNNSKSTFGIQNENTYAPFFCFLDANYGGATMSKSADIWDSYTDQSQYFTGSATGCIDMRTLLKDSSATTWRVDNVSFYATSGSAATYSYLYFGSAPLDNGYEEEPVTVIKGDVNGDGDVTTFDARMVMLETLKDSDTFTDLQFVAADMSGDNSLSTTDVRLIILKALSD